MPTKKIKLGEKVPDFKASSTGNKIIKLSSLKGKNILSLFFENSTRTKMSFELAAKRLSADVTSFSSGTSSLKKGESFKDTIQNIHSCLLYTSPSPRD